MTISRLPTNISLEEAMHYAELQDGRIHLTDDISPFSTRDVIRDMEYALEITPETKLILFINSPGGEYHSSIGLYDYIVRLQKLRSTYVTGFVQGQAASAASMIILQACDTRISSVHSRFLLHEPGRWGTTNIEKVSSIQDTTNDLKEIHSVVLGILADRSGKKVSVIRTELERRDVWLSATEALAWGLIDEIV